MQVSLTRLVISVVWTAMSLADVRAQVPAGHYVVATFASGNRAPGGLFLVHPRIPGMPTPVTQLSPELTTGANAVSVRADGSLLVGELGPPSTQIDLHWLVLQGSRVARATKIRIGTVGRLQFAGGINEIAPLPDGTVLLAVNNLGTGPLLIVDPVQRTVRPVAMPAMTGICNAVGVDAGGKNAYFAMVSASSPVAEIHRVALPAGGSPLRIGQSLAVSGISVDRRDRIIHTALTAVAAMDPRTGVVTSVGTAGATVNALALERVTDDIVCVLNGFGPDGPAVKRMAPNGATVTLTNRLTGVPAGIDVYRSPATIGVPTPGNRTYRWQVEPNPGDLPQVGNARFALGVGANGPGAVGLLFASPSTVAATLLGVQLYLPPTALYPLGSVPHSGTLHMPIPNLPALAGMTMYLQSFHPDTGAPGGIAATEGLRLSILR